MSTRPDVMLAGETGLTAHDPPPGSSTAARSRAGGLPCSPASTGAPSYNLAGWRTCSRTSSTTSSLRRSTLTTGPSSSTTRYVASKWELSESDECQKRMGILFVLKMPKACRYINITPLHEYHYVYCVRSVFQYLSNVSSVSCQKNYVL